MSAQSNASGVRALSDIVCLFVIPDVEQVEECPLDTVDAILLILQSVLACEGLGVDRGPVLASIEVEEMKIC